MAELDHYKANHKYKRELASRGGHGWHARTTRTGEQTVSSPCAGGGDPANPETCKRQHHGNVITSKLQLMRFAKR